MSGVTGVWPGTTKESVELAEALSHNCSCEFQNGVRVVTCGAHSLLTTDQRTLDHLVFAKRMAERLKAEEGTEGHTWQQP